MRRRNLIFGLLTVATLRGARAQQSKKVHRIAVADPSHPVDGFNDASNEPFAKAFFGELRRLGYVEGENLLIERYHGEGRATHYPDLARDVVRRDPDLIFAINTPLVLDLKAATTTIPIVGVFALPVEAGIVPSLARPGGNITGVAVDIGIEQWGKRLQLLTAGRGASDHVGLSRHTRSQRTRASASRAWSEVGSNPCWPVAQSSDK